MSATSRKFGCGLMLSVGLISGLNCGKATDSAGDGDGDSDSGDGDGDGDGDDPVGGNGGGGTGGLSSAAGGAGSGTGGIQNSPVTDECWFEKGGSCGGMGGAVEDCPVTADLEVICSVHRFGYAPVSLPSAEGEGLQFVTQMQFTSGNVDRHGQLEDDGSVTLTDLRAGPATNASRYFPIGVHPDTYAVDLLEEQNDLISVSQPYFPSAGAATWVPALNFASSLRIWERAPDGTLHVLASRTDFTEGYAYGTAAGGMTDASADWTEFPMALGFTRASEPVGFSPADDDPQTLVAQRPGQAATEVTSFDDDVVVVDAVLGVVDADQEPDYLVLAAGGGVLRLAPDPGSGLDSIDLPLEWSDSGDCSAEGCNGTCDFQGDFVSAESAARTTDGRIWVAAHVVHEDTTTAYWVVTSEDAYICDSVYDRDESTSEVILYEVNLHDGSVSEVLTLPVAGLVPTELNGLKFADYLWKTLALTPNGKELLLTFPVITPDRGRHQFRTVRVDTTQIP